MSKLELELPVGDDEWDALATTVPGRGRSISRDAVQDEDLGPVYIATIELERTSIEANGQTYQLSPGLAVTADIRTGTRSIISYLLSPLQSTISQAARER